MTANTSAIWQHAALTNYHFLVADQELYQKAYLLVKNVDKFSWEKSGVWISRQKQYKTERAMGVGRRTREEIVKWNQTKALRFQTGGRHQTSSTSLRGT